MSFFDCLADAIDEGSADRERGVRAQAMWKEISDQYERQGYSRHNAEALAGEDVKEAFKREFGEKRHAYLSQMEFIRRSNVEIDSASLADLRHIHTRSVEKMDYESRALVRRFNGLIGDFLQKHHVDTFGRMKDPTGASDFLKEFFERGSGSADAVALSDAVKSATEQMRLMFNEAGGNVGKLDDWFPQRHNTYEMRKAGFKPWVDSIKDRINWSKMEDHLTGRPFQVEGGPPPSEASQMRLLQEIYDNAVFGKASKDAKYGFKDGTSLKNRYAKERVIHFNSSQDWIDYNAVFGSGTPFSALTYHVTKMAQDIATIKAFGGAPDVGMKYRADRAANRLRTMGEIDLAHKVEGNADHAEKMMRLFRGPQAPKGPMAAHMARFFSTVRTGASSAFLDRAMISSISDANTMRLAATTMGINPTNVVSTYVDNISRMIKDGSLSPKELLQEQWVMDTMADPGSTLSRFQSEIPAMEIAERLSSASMKVQGLAQHTDAMKHAVQYNVWAKFANEAGNRLNDVDPQLRDLMKKYGITDQDWADFTTSGGRDVKESGAEFLGPLYWREFTDLDARRADEVFLKMQGFLEQQTEYAVPTKSLYGNAVIDPVAYGATPGSFPYESGKSFGMFKSFVSTFTVHQTRRIAAQPTIGGKAGYFANLVGGATVLGAVSLQISEILKGNDPEDMTSPEFWGRAAMKGGGFGIVGDIVSTGEASWGGGFGSYLAGPMAQIGQDAWGLSIGNAFELATGQDTKFGKEAARAVKRYMPMGQTPIIGPAFDRLIADQIQNLLDPNSASDFQKKAQSQQSRSGSGQWWMPGSPVPTRKPDFSAALGALVK